MFHFSRLIGAFNPPLLNLSVLGSLILYPKETWQYLGFIFDRKLSFCQHIDFYANKTISTVKCMKILGNLVWGLISHQKCFLYRSCVLSIILYSFQMWFYNKALLSYLWRSWEKSREGQLFKSLGHFKHLYHSALRLLQALFLSTFILRNLAVL